MERATLYQRALAAIEVKRWDVGRSELTRLLADNPQDARALSLMSACSFNLGELQTAIDQSKQAIASDPSWTHAYYVLSLCYTVAKRFKDAESAIKEALARESENPDFLLVMANLNFARTDWEAGLALIEQALTKDPGHASCLRLKAYGLRQTGRIAEADEVVKHALSLHPEDARLYGEAGWTALRTDAAIAVKHFEEALRLNPQEKSYLRGVREARYQSKWFYRFLRKIFLPWFIVPYYGLWIICCSSLTNEISSLWLYGPIIFLIVCSVVSTAWDWCSDKFNYLKSTYRRRFERAGAVPGAEQDAIFSLEKSLPKINAENAKRLEVPGAMHVSPVSSSGARAAVDQGSNHPLVKWTSKHQSTLLALVVICAIVRLLIGLFRGH